MVPSKQKDYSTQDVLSLLELNPDDLDSNQVTNSEALTADENDEHPEETQKKKEKRFSKNPYAKFGLITLAVGSVAIFLGLLFAQGSSLYSNFSNRTTDPNSSPSADNSNNPDDQPDSLEERNAKLTGELALAEQNQKMKAIREQLDNSKETPKVTIDQGQTPNPPPTPTQPVVHKAPVRPAPVGSPPSPSPSPSPQPVRPPASVTPAAPTASKPAQPPIDPIEQWQRLAQLGSYGGGQQVSQMVASLAEEDTLEQATLVNYSTAGSLQLGQQAQAVLTTPIALPIDLRNTNDEFIFTVSLTEPLQNPQGEDVLSEGSTVVFAIQSVQSGIVSSRAVAVISDGQEYPVAGEALQIRTRNGSPIIAQLKDNYGSEIAKRDGVTFVMGALSQAGELANRATSTSTYSGLGGVSSSSTYNQPNYVGAILEGGFGPLAEQWQQRNQQAISEMKNLSRLWWLDAGLPVQVWVTRSVELGGLHAQTPQ